MQCFLSFGRDSNTQAHCDDLGAAKATLAGLKKKDALGVDYLMRGIGRHRQ
jgi:hypothetical protein